MLTCWYQHDQPQPAKYVYKAHAPHTPTHTDNHGITHVNREQYNENLDYAHRINIFLCEQCATMPDNEPHPPGRYIPIRTVKAEPERLPDQWEIRYTILYRLNNLYIYAPPHSKIYYVTAPKYTPLVKG